MFYTIAWKGMTLCDTHRDLLGQATPKYLGVIQSQDVGGKSIYRTF